jgi:hypothetical protein
MFALSFIHLITVDCPCPRCSTLNMNLFIALHVITPVSSVTATAPTIFLTLALSAFVLPFAQSQYHSWDEK